MSGSIAASLAMMPLANNFAKGLQRHDTAAQDKLFGIQLYSLRNDLPKDPKGVLKQLASYGYKQIEGFEGGTGMFWGMSNLEFKKYMDDLGMNFIASHCNIDQEFERKAAAAAAIGMKYLICPNRGPQKSIDAFKKIADDFNTKGEICRKNGLRFAYHNHEYPFNEIEGQFPQDIMMQNTDPSLVDFEMDIYWVVTGGQDPLMWFKKYPERFKLGHLKDRIKGATERNASCTLGEGSIDYPKIIEGAKTAGMKYFIVEQERYDGTTPMKSAEDDATYMNKLAI
jgi:sugar phosphate isomerase/epimerase